MISLKAEKLTTAKLFQWRGVFLVCEFCISNFSQRRICEAFGF